MRRKIILVLHIDLIVKILLDELLCTWHFSLKPPVPNAFLIGGLMTN